MSSILKALKKLEHEKMSRLPDSVRIDSDILKSTDSPRRYSPMVSIALILLVFGGGSAATYFFMKEPNVPLATSKSQPEPTIQKIQSPPLVKTETLPAEIVVVPSRTESAAEVSRIQTPKPATAIKASAGVIKKTTKAAVSGVSKQPSEPDGDLRPAVATVPALRVNGIAYQNSSADSMAIVNGIPVSNGSTIEGSVVEEVRKDRVLFQRNGEKFEILLGQSNR
jgi:general secretion pathway protein B